MTEKPALRLVASEEDTFEAYPFSILNDYAEPSNTDLRAATKIKIANQLLRKPQRISLVTNHDRHGSIRQHMHQADSKAHKHKLLAHHLENRQLTKALSSEAAVIPFFSCPIQRALNRLTDAR